MPADEHRAIIDRLINDFLNAHDLSAADEIFAEDLIDHQASVTAHGRETVKGFVGGLFRAFPDLHVELNHSLSDGDKICVYVTGRGTHRGEFAGVAPTGRSITLLGMSVMRIANGKVAERWNITDMAGLMQQLTA
jgi:steroid delta-isomerase-like uncharacterized protein